jgi:hypothetical protein
MQKEFESEQMRPLAKAVTKTLEKVRGLVREQVRSAGRNKDRRRQVTKTPEKVRGLVRDRSDPQGAPGTGLRMDPDADPHPACHFDADPDPANHFDSDPDPTFQFVADPDSQHCLLREHPRLQFEHLKLMNFDFMRISIKLFTLMRIRIQFPKIIPIQIRNLTYRESILVDPQTS